jgi:hypothetical protein
MSPLDPPKGEVNSFYPMDIVVKKDNAAAQVGRPAPETLFDKEICLIL